jgi:hypothetical protein
MNINRQTTNVKLSKAEVDMIRAMIVYLTTEDTDLEDKFMDKMFDLEVKFDDIAMQFLA